MADPIKTRTLYDITSDLLAMEDLLIEVGGVIEDDATAKVVDDWLDGLNDDLVGKADNYAALIRTIEARAAQRREEARRMTERARVDENAARALKDRLRDAMMAMAVPKIEGPRFTVAVQKNGGKPALVFADDADVRTAPDWAKQTVTTIEWNKDAVRERIETADSPDAVPFAHLAHPGYGLRIR